MDNLLFLEVERATPKFNPSVMEGLAVEQLQGVERYVDGLFRSISKGFPPGLRYEGCERCTPQEEFNEISKKRSGKPTVDIAKNNWFLMKYLLSYQAEGSSVKEMLPPSHMHLPFVQQAGITVIRGSTYAISPVLADRGISYGSNSIFIPVQVAKLTYERLDHTYREYGALQAGSPDEITLASANVAWSKVYNRDDRKGAGRTVVSAKHTMAHYLFCKYGVTDTFLRVTNTEIHVGYPEDVNYDTYSQSEWLICGSAAVLCPKTLKMVGSGGVRPKYFMSNIRIAVRRSAWSRTNQALVASFFYVVDHFPERMLPEYIDQPRLWRILMGHLIFGSDQNEGKLAGEVDTHIESLDAYLDDGTRVDLHSAGIRVDDIYQLFGKVIEMLSGMVLRSDFVESTMYDKELMVLRYALFDINKAISHFKFSLLKAMKKTKVKEEIEKALKRNLGQDEIAKINRQHGEVAGVSSPGDNMYHKITSNLVPQTSATGGRGGKKTPLIDPSKQLHASIAEVGSYNNLPKSSPDGRTRINPYVAYDGTYRILRKERFRQMLDLAQRKIQRSK